MYNHQDLEFFYLGSYQSGEDNWLMERINHHAMGSRVETPAVKAKGKVLILEDFDAIRALLSDHFRRQGFDVDSSATLQGALALSREHVPNVLFIDYDLSTESPYMAIQQLHASLPETTIILIGGPLSEGDQARALHAGASKIMEKGYDLSAMDQVATAKTTAYKIANA